MAGPNREARDRALLAPLVAPLIALLVLTLVGCAAPWRSPVVASLDAPPGASAALPGEIRDGWVIVEATVDGHGPLRFILDTGANFSAITRADAASVGIDADRSAYITDIIGDRREYPFGLAGEVVAGPVTLRRVPFIVTDNLAELMAPMGVVGILGYPGFDGFTLDLDYPAGVARVADGRITPDEPGAVPLRRVGHETPEIRIELLDERGDPADARWFAVDSGGAAPLHLPDSMRDWAHHDLGVAIGGGTGLSGVRRTNKVAPLLGPVRVGPTVIEHAVAETDNHHTLIGHELLRLFRVRLDPRSGLAALTPPDPNRTRVAAPRYAGIGINLGFVHEGAITLASIRADSPAARAGLLPNDRVLAIDGVPVADPAFVDRTGWMFDAPPEVALTVRRGDEVFEVTVPTEPLFPDDPDRLRNAGPDLEPEPARLITHPDGTRELVFPDGTRGVITPIQPEPNHDP